jgi:hypothetical protein
MKIISSEDCIEHPMENIFDIEPGTTIITREEFQTTEIIAPDDYDTKDTEIDNQLQAVYDAAMTAFADQAGLLLTNDPKFSARNMEVANAFLSTALAAVSAKSSSKQHKDKMRKVDGPKTVNNNLIMDRNVLLKMIKEQSN